MTPTNLPPHTPPPKSTPFPQTLDSTPTRPISAKRSNPFLDSESILLSTPTKLMKPLAHKSATLSIRDELNIIQLKMKKYDREFYTRLITQIPTGDMVEEHRLRMLELQDRLSQLTGTNPSSPSAPTHPPLPPPPPSSPSSPSSTQEEEEEDTWELLHSPAISTNTATATQPRTPLTEEEEEEEQGGWVIIEKLQLRFCD